MPPLVQHNSPPDSVRVAVEDACADGESVLLWRVTDISPNGSFQERWLAVTTAHVMVVEPNLYFGAIEQFVKDYS